MGRVIRRLRYWVRNPIVIGPPDCPILLRWAIIGGGSLALDRGRQPLIPSKGWSLKLHRFLPNADDRDVHDHPWGFITLVLRGGYNDMVPCPEKHAPYPRSACSRCVRTEGLVVGDRMRPGTVRFRGPHHTHRTKAGPDGCVTLVLTGPKVRTWGFWRAGRFWTHAEYEEEFGFAMRCDDLPLEYRK